MAKEVQKLCKLLLETQLTKKLNISQIVILLK